MKNTYKWSLFCLLLVTMLVFFVPFLAAQNVEEHSQRGQESLWKLLASSGIIGFIIILTSIAMLSLIIEILVKFRKDRLIPIHFVSDMEDLMADEAYDEVIEECAQSPSYFSNSLASALLVKDHGYKTMMEVLQETIDKQSIRMHRKVSWLQLISALGPLLGLLGTVTGMIISFGEIATMETAPKPRDMAYGIYQALITTCLGLWVAIPAQVAHFYFRGKVVEFTLEVNEVCEELLEPFRS